MEKVSTGIRIPMGVYFQGHVVTYRYVVSVGILMRKCMRDGSQNEKDNKEREDGVED